jgi:hypothetical protein
VDDHLAVQYQMGNRQERYGSRHLGERIGQVVPGPGPEPHFRPVLLHDEAVAVVLDLEDPTFPGEGTLPRRGEHRLGLFPVDPLPWRPQIREIRHRLADPVDPALHLLDR